MTIFLIINFMIFTIADCYFSSIFQSPRGTSEYRVVMSSSSKNLNPTLWPEYMVT